MLAVSTPLRSNKDGSCREIMGEMAETCSTITATTGFSSCMDDCFPPASADDDDFSAAGNVLDSIDFDDLFVGMHDVDILPDLEMDSELLAEFSLSLSPDVPAGYEYSVEAQFVDTIISGAAAGVEDNNNNSDDDDKSAVRQVAGLDGGCPLEKEEQGKLDDARKLENAHESKKSQEEEAVVVVMSPTSNKNTSSSPKDGDYYKGKKWSSRNNDAGYSSSTTTTTTTTTTGHSNQSKRKAKVDWTPELHRRFVQAVEQLGVDKAVPSRILEIMGIDCLTRHNIASHLQKYRSHRKHLLAREAEAASWTQKRQMYGGAAAAMGDGGKGGIVNPWHATTIGFPPAMAPLPVPTQAATIHPHHFRPLHVWGHPTHNQSMIMPPPPPPIWPPPTADPFWHPPHQHRVPNGVTPCFPPPPLPTTTRFSASPVPGLPPHAMYRPDLGIPGAGQPSQTAPLDFHPTKESIDAAIGDVLAKPYLPLPIGLKPPAVDSVLVELQRQGVPKIPPSCAA